MQRLGVGMVVAVVVGVGCKGYFKPPDPQRGLQFHQNASYFEASNGFRVFVLPDDSVDVARVEVRYAIGSAADPPGKEGLAHLVEHLMFQTRLPRGEGSVAVVAELARIAQSYNAETTPDYTHYWIQALPEQLPDVFALEMQRLAAGCSTWDDETFLREREVVRNELRQRHAETETEIARLLQEAVYPAQHPYRRDVGGGDESVTRITRADVCAFVSRYYVPANVTLLLVGRTDEAQVRRLAMQWLTKFPRVERPPPIAIPPLAAGGRQLVSHDLPVDDPWVLVAFPLPPRGTRAGRLAEMATGVLELLVNDFGQTYEWARSVDVFPLGGQRAPVLVVAIRLDDVSREQEAIDAVWKSLKWVHRWMASPGEAKEKNISWVYRRESAKHRLIGAFEWLGARGEMFADFAQFDDRPLFLIGRLKELDQIGPSDVRRVAEEVFDSDRATVMVVHPVPGGSRYASSSFAYAARGESDHWKIAADPAEADRPVPLPADRRRRPLPEHYRHESGLEVVLWPHGRLPIVQGLLVLDVGRVDDPKGREGLAETAAGGRADLETTTFWTRQLATDPDKLIEYLSETVRPTETGDYERWQEVTKKDLRQPHRQAELAFDHDLRVAVYGAGHPYARETMTSASIGRIDHDSVKSFRTDHFRAGNGTLILAGMLDPGLVKQHIDYQFAHVGSSGRRARPVPAAAPGRGPQLLAGRAPPGTPVVQLDIRFPAAAGVDRDYATRRVLAGILDGRLRALREERAVTYGLAASYQPNAGPGEWRISGAVDARRADEAVRAVLELLDQLRRDPASWRGEFVLARRQLVEHLLVSASSSGEIAMQLAFNARFGLPDDFADQLVEAIARLAPADVARVIAQELAVDHMVVGAFGAPEIVQRALDAARGGIVRE